MGELYVTKHKQLWSVGGPNVPKEVFQKTRAEVAHLQGWAQTSPAGFHLLPGSGPSHRLGDNCLNVIQVRW